jgi:hypothetical protein
MKDRLLLAFLSLLALVFFGCSMPTDDTSYNGYDDDPEEEKTWTVSFMSQGGSYVEPFYGEYGAISTAWWGIDGSSVLDLESGWEYRD